MNRRSLFKALAGIVAAGAVAKVAPVAAEPVKGGVPLAGALDSPLKFGAFHPDASNASFISFGDAVFFADGTGIRIYQRQRS